MVLPLQLLYVCLTRPFPAWTLLLNYTRRPSQLWRNKNSILVTRSRLLHIHLLPCSTIVRLFLLSSFKIIFTSSSFRPVNRCPQWSRSWCCQTCSRSRVQWAHIRSSTRRPFRSVCFWGYCSTSNYYWLPTSSSYSRNYWQTYDFVQWRSLGW